MIQIALFLKWNVIFFEKYKKLLYADFSNFDNKHYLFSDKNRKALLHFKDEQQHYSIKEFIGLRSKLYSYKTTSNIEEIKCKGHNKHSSKSYLNFQKYKNCHKQ